MDTNIVVVRHGQTYGNIGQLFCGQTETELTPLGIEQARAAGRRLAGTEFAAAISSDLSRARITAELVLEPSAPVPPLAFDERLREMHFGDWETRPGPEIGKEDPEHLIAFFTCRKPAPNGETFGQIRQRTRAAVHDIVAANRGETVLVVSHGNAIMALVAELLGMPEEATWSFAFDNCSITRLRFSKSGRFTLLGLNDAAHIHGLEAREG